MKNIFFYQGLESLTKRCINITNILSFFFSSKLESIKLHATYQLSSHAGHELRNEYGHELHARCEHGPEPA